MKTLLYCSLLIILISCENKEPIVDPVFVDSLITHYKPSPVARTNALDLEFWKKRVEAMPVNFVNQQKYAQALAARFHIYGDINDLKTADSLMQKISRQYKEPAFLLALSGYNMLQHRFSEAKRYLDTIVQMKAELYATQMMLFDVNFELAKYHDATFYLKSAASPKDYAYNFRLSKQEHHEGKVEDAISHMQKAADLAHANPYLKQAALSNVADLYVHNGDLEKANEIYKQCVQLNSCDFHGMMGLGWIALVKDGNDSLAIKLFDFVHRQSKSPDALFRLVQATEEDNQFSKKYAREFVQRASMPVYGNMYNKYLVEIYAGILNEPAKAVTIAQREIQHRATPQTYAWLAWSLFANNQKHEAYRTFQQYVSGKTLEGSELFYMGMMMKGLGKTYTAQQFFKAAKKNKYDLSPAQREKLEREM